MYQPVADQPAIVTDPNGRPLAAIIDYELYLALQEAITIWYRKQQQRQAVIAESQRISTELERHPEQITPTQNLNAVWPLKRQNMWELVIKPSD
ncbi:MAG: hypothetical protein U0350_04030 [Caldilineaceae bacterium]